MVNDLNIGTTISFAFISLKGKSRLITLKHSDQKSG